VQRGEISSAIMMFDELGYREQPPATICPCL